MRGDKCDGPVHHPEPAADSTLIEFQVYFWLLVVAPLLIPPEYDLDQIDSKDIDALGPDLLVLDYQLLADLVLVAVPEPAHHNCLDSGVEFGH